MAKKNNELEQLKEKLRAYSVGSLMASLFGYKAIVTLRAKDAERVLMNKAEVKKILLNDSELKGNYLSKSEELIAIVESEDGKAQGHFTASTLPSYFFAPKPAWKLLTLT